MDGAKPSTLCGADPSAARTPLRRRLAENTKKQIEATCLLAGDAISEGSWGNRTPTSCTQSRNHATRPKLGGLYGRRRPLCDTDPSAR